MWTYALLAMALALTWLAEMLGLVFRQPLWCVLCVSLALVCYAWFVTLRSGGRSAGARRSGSRS